LEYRRIVMRELVCFQCGQAIKTGKFLHCPACGVNYDEKCFMALTSSLIEKGTAKPEVGTEKNLITKIEEFPAWMELGKMIGKEIFINYLLELLEKYPEKRPNSTPEVLYLCNSCTVDVDYQLADAELYQKLAAAKKSKKQIIEFTGPEIDQYQTVAFVQNLSRDQKIRYHELVKTSLPSQIEKINRVSGSIWVFEEPTINENLGVNQFKYGLPAPKVKLRNELL
jgi:hypothetical protein